MIVGIVAISKNFAIGKDGKLPWHYPSDLKFFKETTTGHTIVMGANTWRSIGRALPNRRNVVLSRSGNVDVTGDVLLLKDKMDVLRLDTDSDDNIYVIGGAKTYAEFADVISQWIVTEIPEDVPDADTFFEMALLDGFRETDRIELSDGLVVKSLFRETSLG